VCMILTKKLIIVSISYTIHDVSVNVAISETDCWGCFTCTIRLSMITQWLLSLLKHPILRVRGCICMYSVYDWLQLPWPAILVCWLCMVWIWDCCVLTSVFRVNTSPIWRVMLIVIIWFAFPTGPMNWNTVRYLRYFIK
jgi:hypothetical protein